MGWVEIKLEAVVWVPEKRDFWQTGLGDFDVINEKLKDNFVLIEETPGEQQMTDTPLCDPPDCPDCKKKIAKWEDVIPYNAGDQSCPDWYIACRPCFDEMG